MRRASFIIMAAVVAVLAASCGGLRSGAVIVLRLVVSCDATRLLQWQTVRCVCGIPADGWNENGPVVFLDPHVFRVSWDYDAWELDLREDRENPFVAYVTARPGAEHGLATVGCIARHPDRVHVYRGVQTFYVE